MSLPSLTLALLAWVLIIGCATKEQQPTRAETAIEKYRSAWLEYRGGRIR